MNKMRFNNTAIRAVLGTAGWYSDSEVNGLYLRVGKNVANFYIRKRVGQRIRQILVGSFPQITAEQARTASVKILADLANKKDIAETQSPYIMPTLKQVIDHYAPTQKVPKNVYYSMLCLSHLMEKKVDEITPREIQEIFIQRKDTPQAANKMIRNLSAALHKMEKHIGVPMPNLTIGIIMYPSVSRRRFMNEKEAPLFIKALCKLQTQPRYANQADALLLMIYTGQRKHRVLHMHISEIDVAYRRWNVPGNKIKRPVEHPLNDYAWEIVEKRMAQSKDGYLFHWKGRVLSDCRKTFQKACEMCGIESLHIHDLRRSLGTWMLSTGASIAEVSKTLGHSSITVTEHVYAHLLESKGRAATASAISAMMGLENPD